MNEGRPAFLHDQEGMNSQQNGLNIMKRACPVKGFVFTRSVSFRDGKGPSLKGLLSTHVQSDPLSLPRNPADGCQVDPINPSTPRSKARGMLRVDTERRSQPRFKNRGLAPSNVSTGVAWKEKRRAAGIHRTSSDDVSHKDRRGSMSTRMACRR